MVKLITITDLAKSKLNGVQKEDMPEAKYIRIALKGGGCSGFTYTVQFETNKDEGDLEVNIQKLTPVIIDEVSQQYMNGTTIDYVTENGVEGFKFNNPNNKSCSCSHSE